MAVPTSYADLVTFHGAWPDNRPRALERVAPLPGPLVARPRSASSTSLNPANSGIGVYVSVEDLRTQPESTPTSSRLKVIWAMLPRLFHRTPPKNDGFLPTRTMLIHVGDHRYEIENTNAHGKPLTVLEIGEIIRRLGRVEVDARCRGGKEQRERHQESEDGFQELEFEMDGPDHHRPTSRSRDWHGQETLVCRPSQALFDPPYRPVYVFYYHSVRYEIENPSATEAIPPGRLLQITDVISGHADGINQGEKVCGTAPEDMRWWEMTDQQWENYNANKLHKEENRVGTFCVALGGKTFGGGVGRVYFVLGRSEPAESRNR